MLNIFVSVEMYELFVLLVFVSVVNTAFGYFLFCLFEYINEFG